MSEVVLSNTPIRTLNDLMDQMQQEILDVKSGSTTESQARVILGIRKGQLKTAELGLQYLRLMKPRTGSIKGEVPILPGSAEDSSKVSPPIPHTEKFAS